MTTFTFERGIARMTWDDGFPAAVSFELFRVDRRSGDITAEVQVLDHRPRNGTSPLLHRARLNLLSTRSRSEVARLLEQRAAGPDWPARLELACYRAVEEQRQGEPAILLRDAPLPEHEGYILEPLAVHGDPIITFGDSGATKSYIALAAAASIHSGRQLLANLQPTARVRVGIFDFEWRPEKHLKRLRALWGPGELPDLIYIPCMSAGPLSHQVERLRRIIDREQIEYGFFDSVGLACAGPPEDAAVALDFFQALAYLELRGSWLLAHVNRSGDTERPFGSTFWQASARSTWYVQKVRDQGELVDLHLIHRKVNDGPLLASLGLQFQFASGDASHRVSVIKIPVREEAASVASGGTVADRMVEALRVRQPQTYAELAGALDVALSTIRDKAIAYQGRRFTITTTPGTRTRLVALKGGR